MERERDAQNIVVVSTSIQKRYNLTSAEGSNNNKSGTQKSCIGYGNSKKRTPEKRGNALPRIFKNTNNTMLRERGKGARWEVQAFVVQRFYIQN